MNPVTPPDRPDRPRGDRTGTGRRVLIVALFLIVLVIGLVIVDDLRPDRGYAGSWVYLIPVFAAAGVAGAVWLGRGKGVALALAILLWTAGMSCAAAFQNFEL